MDDMMKVSVELANRGFKFIADPAHTLRQSLAPIGDDGEKQRIIAYASAYAAYCRVLAELGRHQTRVWRPGVFVWVERSQVMRINRILGEMGFKLVVAPVNPCKYYTIESL